MAVPVLCKRKIVSTTFTVIHSDLETVNIKVRFWEAGLKRLRSYASSISYLKLSFVHVVLEAPMCEPGFAVIQPKRRKGESSQHMEDRSEPGCTSILECECGQRLVLIGPEEDRRSRRAVFKCECGRKLTLDDHADQEAFTIT